MPLRWVSSSPTPHWMRWPTRMAVSETTSIRTNVSVFRSPFLRVGSQSQWARMEKLRLSPKMCLSLMVLDRHHEGAFKSQIALTAREADGSVVTAQQLVSNAVRAQIDGDKNFHSELVRDTYAVDYGDRRLFRADDKQTINGDPRYMAFVYTKFRGFYIGESLGAVSPGELEMAASSLQGISFQEDKSNPTCVMKGDDSHFGGVIGGVLSSKPPQPEIATPWRVHLIGGRGRPADQDSSSGLSRSCQAEACSRAGDSASGRRREWKRRALPTNFR